MDNLVGDNFCALIVSTDGDIRNLFVQWITFISQRYKHFARWSFDLQQRALFIALSTCQLFFNGRFQIDDDTTSGETIARFT